MHEVINFRTVASRRTLIDSCCFASSVVQCYAVQCECLCLRRDYVSGMHRAILSACLSHLLAVLTAYQSAK